MTPGTKLGPYEILFAIGAGGIGEVYGARASKFGHEFRSEGIRIDCAGA